MGSATEEIQTPNFPSPDEVTELSLDYYLPRIDKLVLSKDKEFRIIKGVSAPRPLAPADLDDAMTLYTISLPPYVSNINEIRLNYKENRRYTMKDISSIDKRLQKVEFFTSLNNVENLALSDPTEYEDGTRKEKYGTVGENFKNFNIADYRNKDFRVSLHNGFMLPALASYPISLQTILNNSTKRNKKTISLNYTETPAITQGVCTDKTVSIQPFLFGQFNGTLELSPESDYWINETLKPEIISVPERVIEHHHVVREIIKEPAPPVTIQNIYQTTNVITQIIEVPGTAPPPQITTERVIVQEPEPPPVIVSVPTDLDFPRRRRPAIVITNPNAADLYELRYNEEVTFIFDPPIAPYIPPPPAEIPEPPIVAPPEPSISPIDPPLPAEPPVIVEIPWVLPPVSPVTYGCFEEPNWYPVAPIPYDVPETPPFNLSYVPPEIPIFTQPIVLGPNPLDEVTYEQPVVAPSDVARDVNIGREYGSGGRGDLEFGIFQYNRD